VDFLQKYTKLVVSQPRLLQQCYSQRCSTYKFDRTIVTASVGFHLSTRGLQVQRKINLNRHPWENNHNRSGRSSYAPRISLIYLS
jgi:hypothetical protein